MAKERGAHTTVTVGANLSNDERLRLVVLGEDTFAAHLLPMKGIVTIGRAKDCDIRIDHPSISRRHATFEVGAQITVRDLGSANGTRLRGERVEPSARVDPGEVVDVGQVSVVVQRVLVDPKKRSPASPTVQHGREMAAVFALVDRVAKGSISVLLLGETGVGKEVLAERVHQASPRRARPFLRINCSAFAESLLEAELFGYERGAFTGATRTKPGLLETANTGTVLLDEVGDVPAPVQVKLLRVIEQREVIRVGGIEPRSIDVRFIAATNRDLEAEAKDGRFRLDLLYRLNGATIRVPPLRERKSEIAGLARRFLRATCRDLSVSEMKLAPKAIAALEQHHWPGNVRELRNVIERAALVADDVIEARHLALTPPSAPPPAKGADAERTRILDALQRFGGNQTRTARYLGMARGTLIKRLVEYGVQRPRP